MQARGMVAAMARGVLLGLVLAAIAAGCGGRRAATHPPAASTTSPAAGPNFSERQVARAFALTGLRLHDPAPKASSPHLYAAVTMLTSIRPHDGWTVAAYIYPTANGANASFSEDAGEWSASGIASVRVRNLVVVVIPRGHVLSRRAPLFELPKVVYRALDRLP